MGADCRIQRGDLKIDGTRGQGVVIAAVFLKGFAILFGDCLAGRYLMPFHLWDSFSTFAFSVLISQE